MKRTILLVDLQSFYASVEKVLNPDLENKPVVVSGDPEKRSGIILAACPIAKQYGVETAEPLWQALNKCPEATVISPKMQQYIDISMAITNRLQTYSDRVEIFSIDEAFVDLTNQPLLQYYTAEEIAMMIQDDIKKHFGLYIRCGIGIEAKVLSKVACDLSKKTKRGILKLEPENIKEVMWPLPVHKLFGVGSRMEKHFRKMGIRTIGQLANYPLDLLKKRWGVNGEVLWQHANGIDPSPVTNTSHNRQQGIGHHMTLPRDYQPEDVAVPLREMAEEVARRTRANQYRGHVVTCGAQGGDFNLPTGFHRQKKLLEPTNDGGVLYRVAWELFQANWNDMPVRSIGISLEALEDDTYQQLSLFDAETTVGREHLNHTMDNIRDRFGMDAIMYASSLTEAGQIHERANKIGGHYK
ncbi:DNA polymerase IV [Salibacterium aidingense]|uniref:DNA polymerase IV n=1 Tax=Salibacterium aidingense TaxID=384933 RepID=UPI00040CC931|nr:DNA polymerase IV [Salibacterium aidingense]